MYSCPKCSAMSVDINGPFFEKASVTDPYEGLRYKCSRCGYSEKHPAHDAKENVSQALARRLES